MAAPKPKTRFRRWLVRLLIAAAIAAVLFAGSRIYPFLAVPTQRVEAEILVVEGWIFDYAMAAAAGEFENGRYALVATSGMRISAGKAAGEDDSEALQAARSLEAAGVARERIVACPAPETRWNRTSTTARAVRDHLAERGIRYAGVNVVTVGPHARKTWLAYRRIMGPDVRVGIVTVPKKDFDPDRWWASAHGVKMVSKSFAGWFKEWLLGARS